jgi:hypothetical protein
MAQPYVPFARFAIPTAQLSLEVLKQGSIVYECRVDEKNHYVFGCVWCVWCASVCMYMCV